MAFLPLFLHRVSCLGRMEHLCRANLEFVTSMCGGNGKGHGNVGNVGNVRDVWCEDLWGHGGLSMS